MKNYALPFILCFSVGLLSCSTAEKMSLKCPDPKLPCAETNPLTVLSEDGLTGSLQAQMEKAAEQYEQKFGHAPVSTVIIPGGRVDSDLSQSLKTNGYAAIMPWLSSEGRRTLQEEAVRRQVNSAMTGQSEAARQFAIEKALSQLPSSSKSDGELEMAVLPHELGHKWFINQFSSETLPASGHAYGGWAPDWLDEAAAISMEPDSLKTDRRAHFSAMKDTETIIPLREFLTMEHPGAVAARSLSARRNPTGEGSVAIVLSGKEAETFVRESGGSRIVDFYAQSLEFSDYLMTRSDRDNILALTARALSEGQSFESWLEINTVGLPLTFAALEEDWQTYIETMI